jgi:hypothetical protein
MQCMQCVMRAPIASLRTTACPQAPQGSERPHRGLSVAPHAPLPPHHAAPPAAGRRGAHSGPAQAGAREPQPRWRWGGASAGRGRWQRPWQPPTDAAVGHDGGRRRAATTARCHPSRSRASWPRPSISPSAAVLRRCLHAGPGGVRKRAAGRELGHFQPVFELPAGHSSRSRRRRQQHRNGRRRGCGELLCGARFVGRAAHSSHACHACWEWGRGTRQQQQQQHSRRQRAPPRSAGRLHEAAAVQQHTSSAQRQLATRRRSSPLFWG